MVKSKFKKEDIEDFINKKYNIKITLNIVKNEGMQSQVYSYLSNEKNYIIRINQDIEGFKKDK